MEKASTLDPRAHKAADAFLVASTSQEQEGVVGFGADDSRLSSLLPDPGAADGFHLPAVG